VGQFLPGLIGQLYPGVYIIMDIVNDYLVCMGFLAMKLMVHAGQSCFVSSVVNKADNMSAVFLHSEAQVGETEHTAGMRSHPQQHCCPAGGACGGGTVGISEQCTLLGHFHKIGCRNVIAVRLNIPSGIMGMNIYYFQFKDLLPIINGIPLIPIRVNASARMVILTLAFKNAIPYIAD
jgi:hypothetical protein